MPAMPSEGSRGDLGGNRCQRGRFSTVIYSVCLKSASRIAFTLSILGIYRAPKRIVSAIQIDENKIIASVTLTKHVFLFFKKSICSTFNRVFKAWDPSRSTRLAKSFAHTKYQPIWSSLSPFRAILLISHHIFGNPISKKTLKS